LKTAATEFAEMIGMIQRTVNNGIEDYNLLMEGNKRLLAEHDEFLYCYKDLNVELGEVRSDAKKRTAALVLKVKSAEAHNINVATADKK
jgi:hypothetical protein